MSKVHQFLTRNPSVDGFTLIQVLEHINRRTQAGGIDVLLSQALILPEAEQYLMAVVNRFTQKAA